MNYCYITLSHQAPNSMVLSANGMLVLLALVTIKMPLGTLTLVLALQHTLHCASALGRRHHSAGGGFSTDQRSDFSGQIGWGGTGWREGGPRRGPDPGRSGDSVRLCHQIQ